MVDAENLKVKVYNDSTPINEVQPDSGAVLGRYNSGALAI